VQLTRRRFVFGASVAGLAGLLAACGAPATPTPAPKPAEPPKPAAPAAAAPTTAPAAPTKPAEAPKPAEAAKPTEAPKPAAAAPAKTGPAMELIHWSSLTASDGEVWEQVIQNANKANEGKWVIKKDTIPSDQLSVKILSSVATGQAPDFGWKNAGQQVDWIKKSVVVPMDDHLKAAGLNFDDFTKESLDLSRFEGKQYLLPLDGMSFQMLINANHAQEAGLDVTKPPKTGEEMLTWADKLTKREGNKVTRSGFLMVGSGGHNALVWGTVFEQMGGKRTSDDYKKVTLLDGDAARRSAQWTVDLFDKHRVASRDVADRYKAFGTGEGSIFWTGPWTLPGYIKQDGLKFVAVEMPKVGNDNRTVIEIGGQEMYKQDKADRYPVSAQALKWLSDNSFLWNTTGRGTSFRKSALDDPKFKTSGTPWEYRRAFVEGMQFAKIPPLPVAAEPAFRYYFGTAIGKAMDPVWAGTTKVDDGLAALDKVWKEELAKS
jgi:ABC-type glycerol-3-phosphate transport system substrate-binding protein